MKKHVFFVMFVLLLNLNANAAVVIYKDGFPGSLGEKSYLGTKDVMLANNSTYSDRNSANVPPGNQGQNFGARPNMEVGVSSLGQVRHGLIYFDTSSLKGRFKSIDSVTLRLHVTDNGMLSNGDVEGSGTLQLFQVSKANEGWVEGTGVSAQNPYIPSYGESTWSQRIQGSENWAGLPGASMAGVDFLPSVLASQDFVSSTLSGSAIDLNFNDLSLTHLLTDWSRGNNSGLFLKTLNETNGNRISLATREFTNPELRPELIVHYTPAVPLPSALTNIVSGLLCIYFLLFNRKRFLTSV